MAIVETREVMAGFARIEAKLPGAASRVLTRLAWQSRDALRANMASVFDRPTPFTLNSVTVVPAAAKFERPFAVVGFRRYAPKGVPAGRYLEPQVFGGMRALKGLEAALKRGGLLADNRGALPGKWADINQYGNQSSGQITTIMHKTNLMRVQASQPGYGKSQRGPRGKRKNEEYFIVPSGRTDTDLPPGIYRRGKEYGGAPLLVVAFVRAPRYRVRFPMHDVIRKVVVGNINREFAVEFARSALK